MSSAGHGFLAMAVGCAVLVTVGHGLGVDGENAVVGDGDSKGVAGEIIERGLLALAPRRDVNDPGDLPDMARQIDILVDPGEGVAEAGAGTSPAARIGSAGSHPKPST
jgi:hypothetical protein